MYMHMLHREQQVREQLARATGTEFGLALSSSKGRTPAVPQQQNGKNDPKTSARFAAASQFLQCLKETARVVQSRGGQVPGGQTFEEDGFRNTPAQRGHQSLSALIDNNPMDAKLIQPIRKESTQKNEEHLAESQRLLRSFKHRTTPTVIKDMLEEPQKTVYKEDRQKRRSTLVLPPWNRDDAIQRRGSRGMPEEEPEYCFLLLEPQKTAEQVADGVSTRRRKSVFDIKDASARRHSSIRTLQTDLTATSGRRKGSRASIQVKWEPHAAGAPLDIQHLKTISRSSYSCVKIVQLNKTGAAKQITATNNSAKEIPPQDLLVVKSVSKSSLLGLHQLRLADCQAPKYEKTLWLQLQHPSVARLLHTYQDADSMHFASEFYSGGCLKLLLERRRRFACAAVRFYAAQVTMGLEYLHIRKIIHRSLNTSCLVLDVLGNVKICSFSQARMLSGRRLGGGEEDSLFHSFLKHADVRYLAPELVALQPYDSGVDWWALGVIIYELLIGKLPFDGKRVLEEEKCTFGRPVSTCAITSRAQPSCNMDEIGGIFSTKSLILYHQPVWDEGVDMWAKDLVQLFLEKKSEFRLGIMAGRQKQSGSAPIRAHPFFKDTNFQQLERGQVRAPFVPDPFRPGLSNTGFPILEEEEEDKKDAITPRMLPDKMVPKDCLARRWAANATSIDRKDRKTDRAKGATRDVFAGF